MRVAGVSVGVDSEGAEGEVEVGGDDDSRDDGLLGEEELDVSSRRTSREHEEVTRSLNRMKIRSCRLKHFLHQSAESFPSARPCCCFLY